MSWATVARELGVSASTLTQMRERAEIEADGVLQMLRWLRRSPASAASPDGAISEAERLPAAGASQVLRFNTRALHAALDARRATMARCRPPGLVVD